MQASQFLLAKINRSLAENGLMYTFQRAKKNDFGEPTGTTSVIKVLKGIYHEQTGYVSITTADGAKIQSKKVPMILCLFADAKDLNVDDLIVVGLEEYRVTGVSDINNFGVAGDISLEVIQ